MISELSKPSFNNKKVMILLDFVQIRKYCYMRRNEVGFARCFFFCPHSHLLPFRPDPTTDQMMKQEIKTLTR